MTNKVIPFPGRRDPKTQAEVDRLRAFLSQIDGIIAQCEQRVKAENDKPNQTLEDWVESAFITQEGRLSLHYLRIDTLARIMDLLGIDRSRSDNVMPGEYRHPKHRLRPTQPLTARGQE